MTSFGFRSKERRPATLRAGACRRVKSILQNEPAFWFENSHLNPLVASNKAEAGGIWQE